MSNIFDLFKKIEKKADTTPVSFIIAGLGNPGAQYQKTRHNVGFVAVDYIAEKLGVRIDRAKFHSLVAEAKIGEVRLLLMKPETYMNNSGTAIGEAAAFYKIAPDHVLVISDDVAQDPGKMRLRRKGSAGGQKGLNDIITCLGTDAVPRLRMGVGAKPHPSFEMADWVLSNFTKNEMELLMNCFDDAFAGIEKALDGDFDGAMQICNSHIPAEK